MKLIKLEREMGTDNEWYVVISHNDVNWNAILMKETRYNCSKIISAYVNIGYEDTTTDVVKNHKMKPYKKINEDSECIEYEIEEGTSEWYDLTNMDYYGNGTDMKSGQAYEDYRYWKK